MATSQLLLLLMELLSQFLLSMLLGLCQLQQCILPWAQISPFLYTLLQVVLNLQCLCFEASHVYYRENK